MKLVNMKMDAAEYTEELLRPNYSYGICLNLSEDQCDLLGIDRALPPGTLLKIEAVGIVERATESLERDADDKGNDISLSVQITEMGLEPAGTAQNAADILYGKGK